jgi:hypothetical protein
MAPPLVQMYQGGGCPCPNRVQTAVDRPRSIGITSLIICLKGRYASQLAQIGGDVTQARGDGVSRVSFLSPFDKKSVRFALTCAY